MDIHYPKTSESRLENKNPEELQTATGPLDADLFFQVEI
jgi:hypothetical protein